MEDRNSINLTKVAQAETPPAISISGLLKAIPYVLFMIMVSIITIVIFSMIFFAVWSFLNWIADSLLTYMQNPDLLVFIKALNLLITFLISIGLIYTLLRVKFTLGSKRVFELKSYKEKV